MQRTYWVTPRDKLAFFVSIMRELAGDDTQIAFEGNLSNCDFSTIEELPISGEIYFWSSKPTNKHRNTQTIILPLTDTNIKKIIKEVMPHARIMHDIEHIQIQKNNEIQLLVGDNFDNDCISVGSLVSLEFLSSLKNNGIIRKIQTVAEAKAKYPWANT
jgi:hypothetical protein